ncbi:hypothetical protein P8A21_39815 (plasmid) [Streptomyces poriferorum]|uniref:hypothetical protein n=1 Tax=Streptomyces poriferorum TaxID=2798799 RepID=UPI00273E2804|nr:hypothetical protein [Streptomyces sp. Alt1]WLQ53698.1 hypothetical protein P8A21_39815 [Streptomyces sp. Alt1]
MEIIIKGATEEFAEKLVALAAQHHAELTISTVQPGWTVDRAERYLRDLTAGSRRMAEMVFVDGDGYIDAEQLRNVVGKLNGPSNGLKRAVDRGVRKGWWPEGTPAPITPVSDPNNPSWHQNIAYQMDREILPVFREALTRIAAAKKAAEDLGITPGGLGKTSSPWTPDTSTLAGYHLVDLDGGSLPAPADDDQGEEGQQS